MVTIKESKLVIELEHPCPQEVLKGIQLEIINCLQNQPEEDEKGYYLLELLKQTMDLDA